MNVFVLSTGRCGSTTFVRACSHISNYTTGHETRMKKLGPERLAYPENHIESDNRLTWFLGRLDENFGDSAIYVHLVRDRDATARSYSQRLFDHGIMQGYYNSILARLDRDPAQPPDGQLWVEIGRDYWDTANANIRLFLKDKTSKMTFELENAEEDFGRFWDMIGARGDLDAALAEWSVRYNRTGANSGPNHSLKHRVRRKFERIMNVLAS